MSELIDLTTPKHTFDVSTTETRAGQSYMGPTVRINAHNEWDARERAEKAGYEVNPYFPPEQVKERR